MTADTPGRPATIVISDWLANCSVGQWTPFEAATALSRALEKEGYTIAVAKPADDGVREAIIALLAVARAAYDLADNSEITGLRAADEVVTIQTSDFHKLDQAINRLDDLPDDQPGYVMSPVAKAEWALRSFESALTTKAQKPAERIVAHEDCLNCQCQPHERCKP